VAGFFHIDFEPNTANGAAGLASLQAHRSGSNLPRLLSAGVLDWYSTIDQSYMSFSWRSGSKHSKKH
jgi:hypothetical protein